ncbi:hypothetical protein VTJ49DRAFT_4716 [Mycothermus thermophilus]|uniref:AB hydrolase-1 domain-containing protein n=1 Tax=Humicola insolens TaxID=85995 RepID=A0ABR3V5L4_HUMIN
MTGNPRPKVSNDVIATFITVLVLGRIMERKRCLGLAELHDPKSLGVEPALDLVLIHGLNGDYLSTWTYTGGSGSDVSKPVCWPTDLLPTALPSVRVLSFDYNADIYGNTSVNKIRCHARSLLGRLAQREGPPGRPIVFVAHSLGGIILKQIFFSTPHFGGDRSRWLSIARSFSPLLPWRMSWRRGRYHPLVDALVRGSTEISDLCEDFKFLAPRFQIASFYETRKWPGTNRPILDKLSALMFVACEESMPLDKHHVEICRFWGAEDDGFRHTCDFIMRMAGWKS